MEYARGSEWRRWDFHLHTPNTKKNDQFKSENGLSKWELFYKNILDYIGDGKDPKKSIAAIGITDYFSIENYKKIIAEEKLKNKVDFIFPNIELRCLPLKDGIQMNLHLLINPSFVDKIDTIVLSNLKYKTNSTEYCARRDDLIRFGKDLDNSLIDEERAYIKGVENFRINFDDIIALFKNHPECEDNILVAMPNSSVDGASAIANPTISSFLQDLFEYRKELYRTSNLILSANQSDVDFFLGKKEKKPDKIIPCIWGCDAHINSRIFEPLDNNGTPTKRYCWIKADPTWEGLKQLLFEPEGRVKIQEFCPSDRIDNYRIIDRVVIEDDVTPHRFSNDDILLNESLTCIIGLKSSGKSILLQNIAKAISVEEVSRRLDVLNDGKKRKSFNFPIKVYWKDGLTSTIENSSDKKIIYIPQSYLNKLMDDLAEKTEIDNIIESVVLQNKDFKQLSVKFSQELIELQKRMDSLILDLTYKNSEINSQNDHIKDLGNKESVQKNITELKKKKEELAKLLNISKEEIENFDSSVAKKIGLELEKTTLISDKENILQVENIVEINDFLCIKKDIVKEELNKVIEKTILHTKTNWNSDKNQIISKIDKLIGENEKDLDVQEKIIQELKPKIDSNEEIKKIEINLRKEEESLRIITQEEALLKKLKQEFEQVLNEITSVTSIREIKYDIFVEQFKKLNFEYADENFKIVAMKRRRRLLFEEDFKKIFTQSALSLINKGVFKDFNEPLLIVENEFDENCKKDFILAILNNTNKKVLMTKYDVNQALKEILKDFDNIIYTVEMDGDLIESMSPGKKALVLLKLLISLDKSTCPILIDQPEDDLDNLSIASDLVSFIKERKKDRQIILVTHNANLALGCDAEEILVANQEIENNVKSKNKAFKFEYRSGSIENTNSIDKATFLGRRGIQNHVCEILEGGKEAFNARKNKYTSV